MPAFRRNLRCFVAAVVWFGAWNMGFAAPSLKQQERESLRKALTDIIRSTPLGQARMSVHMVSLDDGSVVFSQNGDELLNPASNVKLVTAAAVLARLGLDYRFETEFLTDDWLREGKTKNLYVKGKGDPSVTTERLWGVVSEVAHTGLREITGDLVLDDTFFDADRVPPGYDQENSDRAYMAPPGALSLNSNAVGIYLRPGQALGSAGVVEVEPPSDFFVVDNRLKTGGRLDRKFDVALRKERDGRHKMVVTGLVPQDRGSWSLWKKIDEPALYYGYTLKQMLATKGITLKGRVRLGTTPTSARVLYVASSEPLDIVLKRLNKNSSNFFAENLLKTLGAELKGVPGTTAKGVEAVEDFLEQEVGIFRGSYIMKNGSGLNDTNRFSAAQMVRILEHMTERFAVSFEYWSALTVAGKDGTLKYRFEGSDAVGRLRGKTGTLENVSALSGFVQAMGGERFLFSVLVNDFPGRAGTVVKHIDALGAKLASTGTPLGPQHVAADLASHPSWVHPGDDAKVRFQTFSMVAAQKDRRNIPFLRTAWVNENDAALRLVLADAVFQADPRDALGARMVLDSMKPQDESWTRLRKWATESKMEIPGLESLLEIASSGDFEAQGKLMECAKVWVKDTDAQAWVARALAEVAQHAPEEFIVSLRAAWNASADAEFQLLAQGLVAAKLADHPFWTALKRAQGSPEMGLADFARRTETLLALKVARLKEMPASATRALEEVKATPAAAPAPTSASVDNRPGG